MKSILRNDMEMTEASHPQCLVKRTPSTRTITGFNTPINDLTIYDARGKKVLVIAHYYLQQSIDVSQLCNGIYHILLNSGSGVQGISFCLNH